MTTASPPVLNRLITLVSTRASGFFVPVEYLYWGFYDVRRSLLGDYGNGVWNVYGLSIDFDNGEFDPRPVSDFLVATGFTLSFRDSDRRGVPIGTLNFEPGQLLYILNPDDDFNWVVFNIDAVFLEPVSPGTAKRFTVSGGVLVGADFQREPYL